MRGGTCDLCPLKLDFPRRCVTDEPIQWTWDVREGNGRHCPVLLTRDWTELWTAYAWVKQGFLPRNGGWTDQHAAFVTAVDILRAEAHVVELERARELRAQSEA